MQCEIADQEPINNGLIRVAFMSHNLTCLRIDDKLIEGAWMFRCSKHIKENHRLALCLGEPQTPLAQLRADST